MSLACKKPSLGFRETFSAMSYWIVDYLLIDCAGVLPKYFSSEWSLAQYHLPEEAKSIVAFGPQKHTLIIVGADGR
jgi:hypothetical protein